MNNEAAQRIAELRDENERLRNQVERLWERYKYVSDQWTEQLCTNIDRVFGKDAEQRDLEAKRYRVLRKIVTRVEYGGDTPLNDYLDDLSDRAIAEVKS